MVASGKGDRLFTFLPFCTVCILYYVHLFLLLKTGKMVRGEDSVVNVNAISALLFVFPCSRA